MWYLEGWMRIVARGGAAEETPLSQGVGEDCLVLPVNFSALPEMKFLLELYLYGFR